MNKKVYVFKNGQRIIVEDGKVIGAGPTILDCYWSEQFENESELMNRNDIESVIEYSQFFMQYYNKESYCANCDIEYVKYYQHLSNNGSIVSECNYENFSYY